MGYDFYLVYYFFLFLEIAIEKIIHLDKNSKFAKRLKNICIMF